MDFFFGFTGKSVKSKTVNSRAEILDYSKIKIGDRVRILLSENSCYSCEYYPEHQDNQMISKLNLSDGLEVIEIVLNKFHVVRFLSNAIDQTRRAEVKKEPVLKRSRYQEIGHHDGNPKSKI